jgi:hypothetical protein
MIFQIPKKLLPQITYQAPEHVFCSRCRYVNKSDHKFCTNCGIPLSDGDQEQLLFNIRDKQRKESLARSEYNVRVARATLYVLAALCLTGTAIILSDLDDRYIWGILCLTGAVLYFILGRWSIQKPFTALLVSLVVVGTFTSVSILSKPEKTFTTLEGTYAFVFFLIIMILLGRGVKSAFQADLTKEEMEVL